ncbi:MAG: hypothetical protein ACLFUE_08640 [Desulfobacteraceae bacterium]|jgi:orotate phosphoribosyltransferase
MESYKRRLSRTLADSGALFFEDGLRLKDGRPTPYFVNMGMFRTGRLAMELGAHFADMMVEQGLSDASDIILGPSYKGSAIALAAAAALYRGHGVDLLFDYDRKEAKTHGEGSLGRSVLVNGTLFDGCRIFMVDDVATSMGTKEDLMERVGAEAVARGLRIHWTGIGIGVDREQTTAVYDHEGRPLERAGADDAVGSFTARTGVRVFSVAGIRDIVNYIYEEGIPVLIRGERRPMDRETKAVFDAYMEVYGV